MDVAIYTYNMYTQLAIYIYDIYTQLTIYTISCSIQCMVGLVLFYNKHYKINICKAYV